MWRIPCRYQLADNIMLSSILQLTALIAIPWKFSLTKSFVLRPRGIITIVPGEKLAGAVSSAMTAANKHVRWTVQSLLALIKYTLKSSAEKNVNTKCWPAFLNTIVIFVVWDGWKRLLCLKKTFYSPFLVWLRWERTSVIPWSSFIFWTLDHPSIYCIPFNVIVSAVSYRYRRFSERIDIKFLDQVLI